MMVVAPVEIRTSARGISEMGFLLGLKNNIPENQFAE